MAKVEFDFAGSQLSKNLDKASVKIGAALLMYASTKSKQLESKMKVNRPWTDRTGMAKALLSSSVSQPDAHTIRITLSHGVEYGIWLELANGKNYAIIAPTIRQESPRIISDLNDLWGKIKL